ncbi:MAG: hypothetical protein Kow0025_17620 [Thermodesulfovibrionales bacterium]
MDGDLDLAVKEAHAFFRERRLTVSAAESCTGGLLSHYLTALPGSSDFFEGGVVSYSKRMKRSILGVAEETLSSHGAVSRETAIEMALRMREVAGTDFAVATTGNLGPGALEDKETGLVYIAVSGGKGTEVRELRLAGGRDENRRRACLEALRFLLESASGRGEDAPR